MHGAGPDQCIGLTGGNNWAFRACRTSILFSSCTDGDIGSDCCLQIDSRGTGSDVREVRKVLIIVFVTVNWSRAGMGKQPPALGTSLSCWPAVTSPAALSLPPKKIQYVLLDFFFVQRIHKYKTGAPESVLDVFFGFRPR